MVINLFPLFLKTSVFPLIKNIFFCVDSKGAGGIKRELVSEWALMIAICGACFLINGSMNA